MLKDKQKFYSHTVPILAAVAGNIFWGFSYLLTRIALRLVEPEHLLGLRFIAAFILMNIILLTGKEKLNFKGKNLVPVFALAVTELACFYCESYGVLYTNATFSGVLLAAVPVVALVFAAVFLREYPTKRQIIFCFLPITGVIIISLSGSSLGVAQPIGIFFLLCACMTHSTFRVINRFASVGFSSFERTYVMLGVCTVVYTAVALFKLDFNMQLFIEPLRHMEFLLPMTALSVFCSVGANMLVNYAAAKLTVLELSTIGTVSTVVSMFGGIIFLREPFSAMMLMGAVLIFIGIRQVTKPQT